MKMNWVSGLIVVLLAIIPSSAKAAPAEMLGSNLQEFCTDQNVESRVACRFYILGIYQGVTLTAGILKDTTHFCLPDDLAQSEVLKSVQTELEAEFAAFPQDKNLAAAGLVGAALVKHYPCKP